MSKQIIINTDSQKTRIAIVEDGDLAELFIETEEHERTLGNLFVGRVRRIMPSIQAAFVDIGQKQDAFLHFSDLSENLADWLAFLGEETPEIGRFKPQHLTTHKGRKRRRPLHGRRHDTDAADDPEEEEEDDFELEDDGSDDDESDDTQHHARPDARTRGRRRSMQRRLAPRSRDDDQDDGDGQDSEPEGPPVHTLLQRDQSILVKISKEPIAQKGSRITTDVSLAGRFLVLVPMANYVAVSKKIASFKERRRLRALAKSLLPDGFGVIVRTVAQSQTAKTLDTDLRLLVERWRKIESRLAGHPKSPIVVHEDVNMVSSVIRDLFSDNYDRILVDNQRLYRNVKSYVQAVAPDMGVTVQLHQSDEPIFRAAGIDRKVAEAFERRINLPSGAYLFFEQTEAMHVIDVNSGRAGKGLSQEESSLKVNLEAARAIARQVRIRDLGGIIVVDFIDLRSERSRRKVLEELKKEFRRDRAVTKLLPMSDFGLIQITRQRLRPSITTTFSDIHTPGLPAEGPLSSDHDQASRISLPAVHTLEALTPEAMLDKFEDWIRAYRAAGHRAPVKLAVHPFVAAYLNRRLPSQSTRWFLRFGQRVRIESDVEQDVSTWRMIDVASSTDVTRIPEKPKKEKPAVEKPADTSREKEQTEVRDRDERGRGRGRRDGRRGGREGGSRSSDSSGRSGESGSGRRSDVSGRRDDRRRSGDVSRGDSGESRSGDAGSGHGQRQGGERRDDSSGRGDRERGSGRDERNRGSGRDDRERGSGRDDRERGSGRDDRERSPEKDARSGSDRASARDTQDRPSSDERRSRDDRSRGTDRPGKDERDRSGAGEPTGDRPKASDREKQEIADKPETRGRRDGRAKRNDRDSSNDIPTTPESGGAGSEGEANEDASARKGGRPSSRRGSRGGTGRGPAKTVDAAVEGPPPTVEQGDSGNDEGGEPRRTRRRGGRGRGGRGRGGRGSGSQEGTDDASSAPDNPAPEGSKDA